MSVGNINSYGDKKNNFSFQYKVLQGLTSLFSAFTGVTSGAVRTSNILRTISSGTLDAGKFSVSIANVGLADGTVKGVTLKSKETISFDAGSINNTLDAIAYNATGTEFLIIYIS